MRSNNYHGYWFKCQQCLWHGIRHHHTKKCPHCDGKTLTKERRATKEEAADAFAQASANYQEIPE